MCVRAYAREDKLQVLSQFILWFSICFLMRDISTPNRPIKTSRRFMKNNTSFCEKQAVVLRRTIRRFLKAFSVRLEDPQIGHSL